MLKLPSVKRLTLHSQTLFLSLLVIKDCLAGHLCHSVVKIQVSCCVFSRGKSFNGYGGNLPGFQCNLPGFQCKLRPPWCTVYCGFKHLSDKTGILGFYCLSDCHLFSILILLERGQERELATILTEDLCTL